MWQYQNTDELYHHGILGQKWGIRRYQNPDGTLTPLGRKKAGKLAEKYAKVTGKKLIVKKRSVLGNENKSIKQMTDQEIRDKINRINLENKYASLLQKQQKSVSPVTKKKGQSFIKKSFKSIGSGVQGGISDGTREIVKKLIVRAFNKSTSNNSGENTYKTKKKIKNYDRDLGNDLKHEASNIIKEFNDGFKQYQQNNPNKTHKRSWLREQKLKAREFDEKFYKIFH